MHGRVDLANAHNKLEVPHFAIAAIKHGVTKTWPTFGGEPRPRERQNILAHKKCPRLIRSDGDVAKKNK
jgi:hypothetical protein